MKTYTKSLLAILLLFSAKSFCLPNMNSLPTSVFTIFLDFDGHTVTSSSWNNGNTLFCAPAPLSDLQMTEIFNRVSEDYRPFNMNITTDSTVFRNAPLNKRIRIIITPTSAWSPGVGGVAYIGSFTWGDDTPAFVFTDRLANSPKYIGECVSHESGHTVGLAHQSSYDANCTMTEQYATGTGAGEIGWAPIMGNSYYKNMTGWNFGPTPYGCSNIQDNLTIITTQNGFSYRSDDYSNLPNASATRLSDGFSVNGIITTNQDKDAFKYVISENSTLHIEATPFRLNSANAGANLDVEVSLYNGAGTLIQVYSPGDRMNVVIDTILNTGTYYFVISGAGNINTGNYSSLGSYTFTGVRGTLPIHDITLKGSNEKGRHLLNWNIIADEPISKQVLEVSSNGITFRPLSEINSSEKSFVYQPGNNSVWYYRLKATSVLDQTAYSNIIALKNGSEIKFNVSTFVQHNIKINGNDNYEYVLADANGRLLRKGRGVNGFNQVDVSNLASGLYIFQIITTTTRQTERIIKQ